MRLVHVVHFGHGDQYAGRQHQVVEKQHRHGILVGREHRCAEPDRAQNAGVYINGTQWDGFQTERNELVSHLHDNKITNTIVLSGDMHWFAAGDGPVVPRNLGGTELKRLHRDRRRSTEGKLGLLLRCVRSVAS